MGNLGSSDSRWPYPGARWWKFDFHTHTPASTDARDPDPDTGEEVAPREWLLGFMEAEVDCVAVTDHNSGDWIDRLKAELAAMETDPPAGYRPLHVFPGVELSVNSGFHLLAIFGKEASTSDIDSLLGAVGYDGKKGDSDGVTEPSGVEVVRTVLSRGGIPIPAHVDRPKGLLQIATGADQEDGKGQSTKQDPNTIRQILDCDEILAMEVIGRSFEKPEVYRERKLDWTEVLGSDSHPPYTTEGSGPGSRYTWVKMAEPSLEGLWLALLDGARFSVRRSDEAAFNPFAVPEHFIESIRVQEARYMGRGDPAELRFSPLLNAIVGGRGTGKSTVLHAIRLAAGRERDVLDLEHSIPSTTFEQFNQVPRDRDDTGGLTDGTRIEWTVNRDGVGHRVTCHPGKGSAQHTVEDQSGGEWSESSSQSISPERFPLRIFSQGQIAELAGGSRAALLKLIDDAARGKELRSRFEEAKSSYRASKARIRELEGQLDREDNVQVGLDDVERKLKRFEMSDHRTVLKEFRDRSRQQREAGRQFAHVRDAADRITSLVDEIEPQELPAEMAERDSEADNSFRQVMEAVGGVVEAAARALLDKGNELREAAKEHEHALSAGEWQASLDRATREYERFVTELKGEGVADPAEYGALVQERLQLRDEVGDIKSIREECDRLVGESEGHLDRVLEARREISRTRERFLAEALAGNHFVRMSVSRYGADERAVERSLRKALGLDTGARFESDILGRSGSGTGGIVPKLLKGLPIEPSDCARELERRTTRLKQRFESACLGKGDFSVRFNRRLMGEFERDPAFLDRLWVWFPGDGLDVEYSRRGDGRDFQPISQASAGQRAAAMLAFLLAHGDEPLVLDQPEDDLDNHLIYDLVVRQIRENKLRRQVIVVTHNPNVVVNGDAEMLYAMEFISGQCMASRAGSLQDGDIREEVCRVMEGGREAFESRYRRLGPGSAHV